MTTLELVTWADIKPGDTVWSMGDLCLIIGERYRNDDDYDRNFREGIWRFRHQNSKGEIFSPPMELDRRVPRVRE